MSQPAGQLNVVEDSKSDIQESAFFRRRCFRFWNIPCLSKSGDDRKVASGIRVWLDEGIEAVKKLRDWSELVPVSKWKAVVRRLYKTVAGRSKTGKFHYDPLSYALNFDDGNFDEDRFLMGFSSRYAARRLLSGGQLKEVHALTCGVNCG